MGERIVTSISIYAEDRSALEKLRRRWGCRSWSEVVRLLIADASSLPLPPVVGARQRQESDESASASERA